MVLYLVDRESDSTAVGETDSPDGVLDLVEGAGPGKYRVTEYLFPFCIPQLLSRLSSGVARNIAGDRVTYDEDTGLHRERAVVALN